MTASAHPIRTIHPVVVGYISFKQPTTALWSWLAGMAASTLFWVLIGLPLALFILSGSLDASTKVTLLAIPFLGLSGAAGITIFAVRFLRWRTSVQEQLSRDMSYHGLKIADSDKIRALRQDGTSVRLTLARVDDNGNKAGLTRIYQVTEIT